MDAVKTHTMLVLRKVALVMRAIIGFGTIIIMAEEYKVGAAQSMGAVKVIIKTRIPSAYQMDVIDQQVHGVKGP